AFRSITSRSARLTGRIVSGSKDAFSARQPEAVKSPSCGLLGAGRDAGPVFFGISTLARPFPIYKRTGGAPARAHVTRRRVAAQQPDGIPVDDDPELGAARLQVVPQLELSAHRPERSRRPAPQPG